MERVPFDIFVEDTEKHLLTSLGSGSDSENDDDEKPMFGEGDNDDFYERLVINTEMTNLLPSTLYVCFTFTGN